MRVPTPNVSLVELSFVQKKFTVLIKLTLHLKALVKKIKFLKSQKKN